MEIERQKDELSELTVERERLLKMQQHLLKVQQSITAAAQVLILTPARFFDRLVSTVLHESRQLLSQLFIVHIRMHFFKLF